MARKVVFLDRDGTINREVSYLYKISELSIIPGVPAALRRLKQLGFLLFMVSNQAGIARGYYSEADCEALNQYLNDRLREQGAELDGMYYCPHHPEKGIGKYKTECECRKPGSGMLLRAEQELIAGAIPGVLPGDSIDRRHSYILGDKLIDCEAGHRFGIKALLLGSGYGKEEKKLACPGDYDAYFEGMEEAVEWIERQERQGGFRS